MWVTCASAPLYCISCGVSHHVARDKANMEAFDPIHYPNCCNRRLLFPLNHQLHLTEAHHHVLLQHLAENLVLLIQAALATHLRPYNLNENTAWMDGRAPQQARQEGRGGLLLHRCARRSLVDGNVRNRCRRCSGHCSLQNWHSHVRLLLALVGVLGEPGVLSDSDGGGFFVRGACTAAKAATARAGAAWSRRCNEFAIAALNPLYILFLLQMSPSDTVHGCVCSCVELCWLFFVPCEQSAPTCA